MMLNFVQDGSIVGEWELVEMDNLENKEKNTFENIYFEFKSDGTFITKENGNKIFGEYNVLKGVLHMESKEEAIIYRMEIQHNQMHWYDNKGLKYILKKR